MKAIGAVNSTVRTATQTYIARWWQSTPVKSWNEVGRDLAMRKGLDALDTARLLALQNLSGADASINCWNDKYYWDFWRPWNAIQRAAEDGNPATEPDAGWLPLIAAPYPDHPSGHLCLDGAHTRILWKFFGNRVRGGFSITSISTFLATCGCPHPPLRQLLAGARRGRRSPHLGRPALPHRRPPGQGARPERREVRGHALPPARRPPPPLSEAAAPRSASGSRTGGCSDLRPRDPIGSLARGGEGEALLSQRPFTGWSPTPPRPAGATFTFHEEVERHRSPSSREGS